MSIYDDPRNFFDSLPPGLPRPSSFPTAAKVKQEAKTLSKKIFATWNILHSILDRHEGLIRRRWKKKSQGQRKKILLAAWPNMSSSHRPDYVAMDKETPQELARGTKYRDAYILPYINLEDLVQPNSLLLFLHSRGRQLPDAFAHADIEAGHLGVVNQAIERPFLNRYTMLFHGRTTPETYGEVISWDDDDDAFDLLMSNMGKCPGDGLLILEIQSKVLAFLLQCCRLILADIPAASLIGDDAPVLPDPGPVMADPTAWRSLAAMAEEAPYRVPARLDLQRLQAIIGAKLSAAKDHVWALREDPGYFANAVKTASTHRQEALLDVHGKNHWYFDTPVYWNFVLGSLITSAYGYLVVWEELHKQLTNLIKLEKWYKNEISPDRDLPLEYRNALLIFRFHLERAVIGPCDELRMIVPPSPPLRSFFVREAPQPNSYMIRVRTKRGTNRLLYLLGILWDKRQLFLHRISNVMDELNRYLRNDLSQKNLISSLVAETISELSVLGECIRQISLYQPWASHADFEETEVNTKLREHHIKAFSQFAAFLDAKQGIDLAELGTPSRVSFHYPVDRRQTRDNVEAMRKAELNLDAFWHFFDTEVARKNGNLQQFGKAHLIIGGRQLHRTPEWVEPVKAARVKEILEPLAQVDVNHKQGPPISVEEEGKKIKTRGMPRLTTLDHEPEPSPACDQPDNQPIFAVSQRAMKVFSVLFYKPSSEADIPGEIPWVDFLHAMVSVGFGAEKMYGSAWQFTPTGLDVEQSIQFHEPHPSSKLPFIVARRYGRRLSRAYGWTGDMFVQE